MTDLVKLEKKQPVTTSLIIAEGVGKDHNSVSVLIKKYKSKLEKKGTLQFKIEKTKGRPKEYWVLNERQTTFLITLMRNNEVVVEFKEKLTDEFYKMKDMIAEISARQRNQEWQELRKTGKLTRKKQTGIIKEFIEYAKAQGSENAGRYYSNITTMENKGLFLLKEKFENIRDILTGQQLQVLSSADQIVENAIKEGMEKEVHYKEIYKLAKERVEVFASLIPKTIVPMVEQIKK